MSLKCRKCPACVFVDEVAPVCLPSQFCEEHAGMSLPLGPDGQIVVPARRGDGFNAPRWREIATEGLPPESGDYWICEEYNGARFVEHREWSHGAWHDPYQPHDPFVDASRFTHWTPFVKPAPPTEESR